MTWSSATLTLTLTLTPTPTPNPKQVRRVRPTVTVDDTVLCEIEAEISSHQAEIAQAQAEMS